MKSILSKLTLGLAVALLAPAMALADTKTFYVCDGYNFTLTAATSAFDEYEWYEAGGSTTIATTESYSGTIALANATTAESKTYVYRVREASCWSDYDTFVVNVLPAIPVSITDANTYCSNEAVTGNIVAELGTLTGLPSGIDYIYAWTLGGNTTGSDDATLAVSAAGAYEVTVTYDMTGVTNDGFILNTCAGTASHTITPATAPTAPVVTLQ